MSDIDTYIENDKKGYLVAKESGISYFDVKELEKDRYLIICDDPNFPLRVELTKKEFKDYLIQYNFRFERKRK